MAESIQTILSPLRIKETISQLALPDTTLQTLMGYNLGVGMLQDETLDGALMFRPGDVTADGMPRQGNVTDWDGRVGQYDIYNNTRKIATARVPGQESARRPPQEVGYMRFTLPRSAETIPLTMEEIHNRRRIGGPSSELDQGGQDYIVHQLTTQAQKVANLVEFQTAAMFRGSYSFIQNGNDLQHVFSGGETTIDYNIPAGNKGTLDMLGDGAIIDADWDAAGTDIPGQLAKIQKAFIALTGKRLANIVIDSLGWEEVKNNTAIATQAGSANVVFEESIKSRPGVIRAVLRALPHYTWYIVDTVLDVWDDSTKTEVSTQLIPTGKAVFLPEADREWVEYQRGSEHVVEGPMDRGMALRAGFYPYAYPTHDPAGWNLSQVFNGFPALKVPKAVAYGDIYTP